MKPSAKDLNVGSWKFDKSDSTQFRGDLKIFKTNILVGHCFQGYQHNNEQHLLKVVARFSNISGDFIDISFTKDVKIIHLAWEKAMSQILDKLFK